MHYNYFRYYDPSAGWYISSDPIGLAGGDANLYGYVLNDPANFIDPQGLMGNPNGPAVPPSSSPSSISQVGGSVGDFINAYTDQWMATNIVGRAHHGWANQDVYFNCRANCEAAQRGLSGEDAAQCMSSARENWDEFWGQSPADTHRDQTANLLGRGGGSTNPSGSCKQISGVFRPGGSFPAEW